MADVINEDINNSEDTEEEETENENEYCFYIPKVIGIIFETIIIALLGYVISIAKCSNQLQAWSIVSVIYQIINVVIKIHKILKKKYSYFILQRRIFKILKGVLYLINLISLLTSVIIGFQVNNNKNAIQISCKNIDKHAINIFMTIFYYQCFCLFTLSLTFISSIIILLCFLQRTRNQDKKEGADSETISENTIIKMFQEWIGIDTPQCSICMEEYGENQKISQLPCGHFYHQECVEQWLKQAGDCPYCRQKISTADDLHEEV